MALVHGPLVHAMDWPLGYQRSKDINMDELLADLNRLIESESAGTPVLEELYEAARQVREHLTAGMGAPAC
jgi:hypothetical protein